jgi:hypothetical protein
MPRKTERDPYAPPPMHHDRSGAVLRIAIMAALLGAAAWGYMSFSNQPQTALVPEVAEEQQMAESGYTTSPSALPPASPAAETTAPAAEPPPAPRSTPRRTAPAEPASEPVPPPSTSTTPVAPATPTPIPPVDVPPAG